MNEYPECNDKGIPRSIDISDEDVYDAMKEIPGYLDITPGDFKEVYRRAYAHAVERLTRRALARDVMTIKVISVRKDTPLLEVARILGARGVAGVPVIDELGAVHLAAVLVDLLDDVLFHHHDQVVFVQEQGPSHPSLPRHRPR